MNELFEACKILQDLGFPTAQTNERSGRTLLALAQVKTGTPWANAQNPLMGVRAIMDWMRNELRHFVAENTRETIRRQTLHQFVDAGLVIYNEDDPTRPTNSSLNNYKLNDKALALLRSFGKEEYGALLGEYLNLAPSLAETYRANREKERIKISLPSGLETSLGAGGQNVLMKAMLYDFCEYFVPNGEVIYIGDADSKMVHFDEGRLLQLGVQVDGHGKMPDLIVYQADKNWLFLLEAASSHGPVDAKRQRELEHLFQGSHAGLVYVSCFPDRAVMRKFLADLAWETEVWLASDPTHMIHLNGDRFLGPYDRQEV